ncbi:hypothetical protein ALO72_200031 [Pseudomonas syringae pv. delphinii]|nr:hypothetical protein ALO72_200031 [Pseudomonas syringae pv. delphinii]
MANTGLPLIGQRVHQGNQWRLAYIGHQRQLVDHLGQTAGLMPAQFIEKAQPGRGVVLKVTLGEVFLERLRAQLGGDVGRVVTEYPVDFLAARLSDVINGLAHLAFPGLAGEHPRHAGLGGEQRQGIGGADHVVQVQRRVLMGCRVEDLLVQRRLSIALAHLGEQDLSGLRHQLRVGPDGPRRMRRQMLAIELPQVRRQALPEPRRYTSAHRLGLGQGVGQEGRISFLRARHHQVRLQLLIGLLSPLGRLFTAWGQADQSVELALQIGRRRVTYPAVVDFNIAWPQRIEQGLILAEAETLIPGHKMFGAVIQTRQFAHQIIESTQLRIAIARLLQRRQRGLHLGNLRTVADERQQQPRAPHHRQAKRQHITHSRNAPAQATAAGLIVEHAVPHRGH